MEIYGFAGVFNAWRKYGAIGFFENLLLRILSLLCQGRIERKFLYAKILGQDEPCVSEYQGFTVRKISPQEMGGGRVLDMEEGFYSALGAFAPNGDLAASGWICFKTFGWRNSDDFGGGRALEAGDAYFFLDWTAGAYRGRGLHKLMIQSRLRECSRLGFKRCLARVDGFNRASRKGFERAGFRKVETFFIIKIFNKTWNGMQYGKKK